VTDSPIADRWRLPLPALERERGFWEFYADRRDQLRALWQASQEMQKDIPDFDTWLLQTEPAVIILQATAFGDDHFVKEMNDWGRSVLFAQFATGTDLDAHAAREELERFPGESDELLLERILLERKAKKAFATDPWYARHARNADARVRDVAITGNGRRKVEIAILSTDHDGVPSPDLVERLQAVLAVPPVARNNDIVTVVPAILTTSDLVADVWLDENASPDVLDGVAEAAKAKWNNSRRLGRDLIASWVSAQIHVAGVHKVIVPMEDIIVAANRAVAIGNITLTIKGRGW